MNTQQHTLKEVEEKYPTLYELYTKQVETTPQHEPGLTARLEGATAENLEAAEVLAGQIKLLAGDELPTILEDYDWICLRVIEEEFHFRRYNRYRLSTFEEALKEVYLNPDVMRHYMNGLLITQIWWSNHTAASSFYEKDFLGGFDREFSHLEIGPGHGFLLYRAIQNPNSTSVEAWDVSDSSIDATREALERLGVEGANLILRDMFDENASPVQFDSVVFSEVLEHMEKPEEALKTIRGLLSDEGRLYINVPVNCPAPDHLFLLRSPEEAVEFVEKCGFSIEKTGFFPQTNMTLEDARKKCATITTVIIAKKA